MRIGTYDLIAYTFPSNLTKVSASKTAWLHFLAHFLADPNEVRCGFEAFQVEHLDSTFEWDVWY